MKEGVGIIGFPEDGLRALHFYIKGLEYPVVAAEYTQQQAGAFRYLDASVKKGDMNSEQVCQWCINHHIYFRILYGIHLTDALRDLRKTVRFYRMRRRLKQYSASLKSHDLHGGDGRLENKYRITKS